MSWSKEVELISSKLKFFPSLTQLAQECLKYDEGHWNSKQIDKEVS